MFDIRFNRFHLIRLNWFSWLDQIWLIELKMRWIDWESRAQSNSGFRVLDLTRGRLPPKITSWIRIRAVAASELRGCDFLSISYSDSLDAWPGNETPKRKKRGKKETDRHKFLNQFEPIWRKSGIQLGQHVACTNASKIIKARHKGGGAHKQS